MEALYWKRPTAAEAAEFGCVVEDYVEPQVEVWEENWAAIQLFIRFSTQWRMGPQGPCGLDYSVIQYELGDMPAPERVDVMGRMRVIEQAAMGQLHKD